MQPVDVMQSQTHPPVRSLWRNRDYMLLWSGQLVSSVGSQVSQLAFPLLILALTHSPAQAGLAGALRALPYLIFSLPAGALIDRWDRKRVMILSDIVRGLALGSIPLAFALGNLTILQLYIVSTIEGTFFVFFNIAEAACLPRVVPKIQLPAATAQNQATDGITALAGPSLGGVLYAFGNAIPFLTDAISYTASVISLFFIKTQFQEKRIVVRRHLWVEIWEGLRWLWQQPLIRFMAILTGASNLVYSGYTLIIIVLAQNMHATPYLIGIILAISGLGAILGAIVAPYFQRNFTFGQVIIASAWFGALAIALLLIAPNLIMLTIVSFFSFISSPIYNVVQFSYRSALIPDTLQGRVNSVFRLIAFGGQPIGLALIGWLLQATGTFTAIISCFVFLAVFAILATINTHVRHAQPLENLA
ncbi:MAG: MFS transporter [Ktedonobacteraceae bacterium]|nr:MFS transporter [Ktedonobacteraceae bacterium]